MRFVMVPVPAEHVREVMNMVLFASPDTDKAAIRDQARIRQVLQSSPDRTRALVQRVAEAAIAGTPLTVAAAAEELDEDEASVRAMVLDVHVRLLHRNLSLVVLQDEPDGDAGGGQRASLLAMEPQRAELVLRILELLRSAGE